MKIGIVYNWKGLKEENYIYTLDELAELDMDLLIQCLTNPDEWHDSVKAECAWKTWRGKLLCSDAQIESFLNGAYNDDPYDKDEDEDEDKDFVSDWYWANQISNDLYGVSSSTMSKELERFNVSKELIQ